MDMSAHVRYARLGAFVLGGAFLLAAAVMLFGGGSLLRRKFRCETYVDESVQGLDAGAAVKFRGVQVGRVESIGFVRSRYAVGDTRVRVILTLSPDDAASLGQGEPEDVFRDYVERGLRVRLASQSITGGVYLELDILDPKENPPPSLPWMPDYPVLPSVRSTGTRLMANAEAILARLERVKIDELVDRLMKLAEAAAVAVGTLKPVTEDAKAFIGEAAGLVKDVRRDLVGETVKDLRSALAALTALLEKEIGPAVRQLRESAAQVPPTLQKAEAALGQLDVSLRRIDRTLAGGGAQAEETIENLRVVTQDLRDLTGTLKRYPAHAVFGEAPPKAKMVEPR
jgi:ABC-type transporter Mla subunit MlaD